MRLSQTTSCFSLMRAIVGSAMLSAAGIFAEGAIAQSLPPCQPPRASEYLLLVLNQKSNTQSQLRSILPSNAVLTVCDYLSTNVVRVESFATADVANAWAQYLTDTAGLRAFVARPSGPLASAAQSTSTPAVGGPSSPATSSTSASNIPSSTNSPAASAPAPSTPAPSNSSATDGYRPQPLGAGYAVVVNYFNRPEVAADVHQATARAVGLVSFNQRPYLLAIHTTDAAAASAVLRSLSGRGLTASIVDSSKVILLTPTVAGTGRR